jgi:cAMP-specific phosphodiesterase 4
LTNYDSYSSYQLANDESHDEDLMSNDKKESNPENPYHNNLHGADVFQSTMYFCKSYEEIGGSFSPFELFSVLFAAYIHDFNHPGLNTTYMICDWPNSGISSTFGIESPLEKHHLAMTFNLMRNKSEFNFLVSCSSVEVSLFRRIVTECVMSTDLAKSMSWISSSRIVFNDLRNASLDVGGINSTPISSVVVMDDKVRADNEKKEMDIKILKMQLSIKCGDVGHPARKLDLHLEWSSRICEEFYRQGDKERDKGMKISPLCDRNVSKSSYPGSQIGFINFVSRPLFTLLNEVLIKVDEDKKPWLLNLKSNVEYWEGKKKENAAAT